MKSYIKNLLLMFISFSAWGQAQGIECLDTPNQHKALIRVRYNQQAKPIVDIDKYKKSSISIFASPNEKIKYDYLIQGFKLYIFNDTDSTITITRYLSTIDVVCEAKAANGEWKEIEPHQSGFCGMSAVDPSFNLPAHHFLWVPVTCYIGTLTTQLRYKLRIGDMYIYSNEFTGQINPGQF